MTWMRHCTWVGQGIFIQIFKFLKEYPIVNSVSDLLKCFQLILVKFVTLEAIYTLFDSIE